MWNKSIVPAWLNMLLISTLGIKLIPKLMILSERSDYKGLNIGTTVYSTRAIH